MSEIEELIENTVSKSIKEFFHQGKEVKHTHVLDHIFPKERRIRSLIGGLETSLGTQLWEPLAKEFAKKNNFILKDEKKFNSSVPLIPEKLRNFISEWVERKNKDPNGVSHEKYVIELKKHIDSNKYSNLESSKIAKGEGVDLWIEKDNIEYFYDIKTNQINAGGGPKLNRSLMNWYAYRLLQDSNKLCYCKIAFPFNPYKEDFWKMVSKKVSPLIPSQEAVVQNEFWDFILGRENTFDSIIETFKKLGENNFGEQFNNIFNH